MTKKKRTRIIRVLLLIGTAVSLYFVPWPIVTAWIAPLPDTVQQQVNKAGAYGFDGIIVGVIRHGKPPVLFSSGHKNRETRVPTDPHDLFKIASVSKLYTAVVIARLVRAGRLSLDDTLSKYFPELNGRIENADKITVRMLVQHRSGIPNFTDMNNYWAHPKSTNKERLALVLDQPARFAPDTRFEYCNTNYLLLYELAGRILGEPEFHFIREEILQPLGLEHTFGSIHDVDPDKVMSGYHIGYENDLKLDDVGVMLATAADLGKFVLALNDGSVFSDAREREIYSSIYKFEHTGLIPGYQTIVKYHKDLDAVVVQFTNTTDFDGYNWNMSEVMYSRIVRILKKRGIEK